jgi:diguanylate cyclase (GGDEF)-like protein/PAS domain S-box-containing protein
LRKDGSVFPKDVRLSPGVYFGRKVVIVVARDITEKKRAEETLKRQYENLKSLYQMTAVLGSGADIESEYNAALDSLQHTLHTERVAILLSGTDGVMRFKAWRGLSEEYRNTVEGHSPWKRNEVNPEPVLVPNALNEPSLASFQSLLQKEGIGALGFIPLVHQGRLLGKFMIYFDEPHEFSADEIQLAQTIAHHVSFAVNRKRAEEALTRSESELRALFASMQDTVLVIDRAGVYQSVVTTSEEKLYVSPDEVVGRHISAYFPDGKVQEFLEVIQRVLKTGETAQIEYQIALEGQSPWFEATISPMGGDMTIWVARDITERKKIESALVHSEKRYRLLAESIADVVWVLDVQSRTFTYVSPSVQNLLGYSADELTGAGLDRVLAPDSLAEIEAIIPVRMGRFLGGDKTAVTEIYQLGHIHKDGRVILAEVVNTVVWNERNELEAVGVTRDITQRKRAEDELRLANLSLQSAHKELQLMFENEQVLARTDSLTQLFNRRYFFELSNREFTASIRYNRPLSIILFDVDGFKTANDTFGHALGDDILIKISQAAKSIVREVDILARYGGDEFTVLLPETGTAQALLIAERIRKSVEAAEIQAGGTSLSVTLSLGIAEIDLDADKSIETIIRRADQALYKAKQKGRNHTVIYSDVQN